MTVFVSFLAGQGRGRLLAKRLMRAAFVEVFAEAVKAALLILARRWRLETSYAKKRRVRNYGSHA